ncbi:unnamed protein product [Effrenium voratum]|nr:unnamed protein product [Effrenium voratum]
MWASSAPVDEADAVNLDTTTLIALTSNLSHGQVGWRFADPELERQATQEAQEPVLKQLEQRLAGRKLCVSRRALSTYQQIVQRMAGPEERARASRVVAALTILEADPVRGISTSKTLTPPMLEVIAVGLEKNMPTSMSNAKVIRALDGKALMLPPHMPRALTEGKQADPASRQHLLQGDELEKMFDNIVGDAEVSAGVGLTAQVKRFWSNADLMRKQTGAERRESKRRKLAQDEQTCAPESGEEPGTCSRPDTASLDLAAGQILADAAFSESRDTTKKRKRPAKGARRRKLAKEQLTCSPEPDEPGTCSPEPDEPGTCSRPDTASLDLAAGQILADAAFSETCSECLAALRKECTAALSGPEFEMKPFDWSPEPTLVAFGSFAQGTALKTSDLDVHLSFQQFAVRRKERQVQYLRAIESSLSGAFQVCSLIDTARVPVLRLSYKELPVDLTMGDAEDCGSVDDAISSILAAGPRARQLVCLVKAFAKANGLVDAYNGYLNSVSWVFLCISFLQAEGCLPAFQETPTDLHAVHLNVETLSRALGFIAKCCSRRHRISLCRSTLGLRPHRGRERLFLEHPKLPARNLAYSLRAPAPKQIARACAAAQLRLRARGPSEIFIGTKMAEELARQAPRKHPGDGQKPSSVKAGASADPGYAFSSAGLRLAMELDRSPEDPRKRSVPERRLEEPQRLGLHWLVLGDFEQLDLLDETPMSAVYRLRHRRTGVTVAGKRIQKGSEVHRSGDYLNEVQMLQKLSAAPYIVSLHGVCEDDADFWTIMELCPGGRLEVWLRQFPHTARKAVLQLLEAVHYLHGKLVCHLDIKPDNVLLSGAGEVRLCDFVTACQLQDAEQQLVGRCGTESFRAPEVCRGAYSGLKADVFSLGRTLQVVEEELCSAKQTWPELADIIPYMLQDPPSRPRAGDVKQFLSGPKRETRAAAGGKPAASKLPAAKASAPMRKGCQSSYCQRLGACICHDTVPTAMAVMTPQERQRHFRRCSTP